MDGLFVMEIVGCDPPVVVIDLSRNFGRHKAIMRGLDEARVLGGFLEQFVFSAIVCHRMKYGWMVDVAWGSEGCKVHKVISI